MNSTENRVTTPVAVTMKAVESSQLERIGYDHATHTLQVDFKRNPERIYQYPGFAPESYEAFLAAPSTGSYFYNHVAHLPFNRFTRETGALEKTTVGDPDQTSGTKEAA